MATAGQRGHHPLAAFLEEVLCSFTQTSSRCTPGLLTTGHCDVNETYSFPVRRGPGSGGDATFPRTTVCLGPWFPSFISLHRGHFFHFLKLSRRPQAICRPRPHVLCRAACSCPSLSLPLPFAGVAPPGWPGARPTPLLLDQDRVRGSLACTSVSFLRVQAQRSPD